MKGKIFNAQEVQAMLNGSKVMFREVIKPQPDNARQQFSTIASSTMRGESGKHRFVEVENLNIITHTKSFKCPYQVGQKIFCKESFFINSFNERMFKATFDYCSKRFSKLKDLYHDKSAKWKPAQHMKQEHSRLTLLIKEIKVERLGEISEEDAIKEGSKPVFYPPDGGSYPLIQGFQELWNATHKKPEEKFEANPWVWVVSFEVINN